MKIQKYLRKILILLVFIVAADSVKAQTLNFILSRDTINTGDLLTITNSSTGFNPNSRFYWQFETCNFYINDSTIICDTTSTGTSQNVSGKFYHDGYCLITLKAIDSIGNIIDTIPFSYRTIFIKNLNSLICPNVSCHDPLPWSPCQYICNGNFEWKSSCPTNQGQLCLAEPWQIYDNGVYNGSSPDYFNSCVTCNYPLPPTYACVDVPNNSLGVQNSHNGGVGYAGFIAVSSGTREYIQQPLKSQLTAGENYHIEMYLSHAEASNWITNKIQLYFSNGQPTQSNYSIIVPANNNQLSNQSSLISSNDWVLYSTDFVAPASNLNWVTIGVFATDPSIHTGYAITPEYVPIQTAYYYIDDVSIISMPIISTTANPTSICIGDCSNLSANGASTYTWLPGNLTGATVNVCPTTTTTYTVTGTSASGCTGTSTVTVTVNIPQPSFTYNTVCLGDISNFNGSATYPSCVSSWVWDFGDGNTGNGQNVSHQYLNSGYYTVELTITDIHGNTYSISHDVLVYESSKPILTGIFNTCHGVTTYNVSNYSSGTGIWTYGIVINGTYTNLGSLNSQNFNINWNNYPTGGLIIVNHTFLYGCSNSDSLMVFPCCTTGADYTYSDITITSAPSCIGCTININGIVTFDANVVITDASTVYMGPNAKIIIAPNRTLQIVKNSIVEACSDLMWDGIYITGNTAICEINASTIMDAKCAVVSDNGGVFHIGYSTFNKNYKDIYVAPYGYSHNGTIIRTKFICTATPKPQYPAITATQTNVGITIIQVPNITIGGTASLADSNYFSQMDVALWILNSTVNVYNNSFKNIVQGSTNPGQVKGFGICAFYLPQYLRYATTYLNAGDKNTSSVFKVNRFTNCTNGIYSYNMEGFVIGYNTFNNSGLSSSQKGTAISIDEPWHATGTTKLINTNIISNIHVGINLNTVNQATVQKNNISKLVYYWAALEPSSGINMSGCNSNTIICNIISNTSVTPTYGIKGSISLGYLHSNTITRMQNGIYFTGASSPTLLQGNKLYYCTYGLHLSDGGVIGPQGNSSTSNNNTWTGSAGYDLYTSNNTDGTQSRYYYKGTPLPSSGSSVFSPIPISSAANNSLLISCTMLPSGLNEITTSVDQGALESIVNDEINYTTYPTESREISQQSVYKYLLNTDTVNISAELKTFVQEKATGDLGKIEMIAQKAFAGDLEQANIVNNTITENEKTVTAIKTVNALLLNTLADDAIHYYKFNDDELLALQNMAGNCPYEYGNAVYMARAALRSVDTTFYQNTCENSNPVLNQKRLGGNNQNSPEISIYPNPANTELHIDCIQPIDMQVLIYDYTGKLVYDKTLNGLKNIINMDRFSNGLYSLRILNNNLQIRTEKVTIIN